jgi:signal transduction histidine kinase/CheY-like chemotaxis protein
MKVQTKVLLLLFLLTAIFVGGLLAFHLTQRRKFRTLAVERSRDRDRDFSALLAERGDRLKVLVEDFSVWDEMVLAIRNSDAAWAGTRMSEETLTSYGVNAFWAYRADRRLFYSLNNRYAENLKELPIPKEALETLFSKQRTCHFFVQVPQGWMEVRGSTVHPSNDRFRETRPEGYFFCGQVWITEYMRRMAQFTGYTMAIVPLKEAAPALASEEELGRIRFSRLLPGWDGQPIARVQAENDSPLIRELNLSSQRLLRALFIFAFAVLALVGGLMWIWVRRPLARLCRSLESKQVAQLEKLTQRRDEFGMLAERMIAFRETEEKLHTAEEHLRHAQKMEAVGRLAGGVAHDFNNLLTAILGYSQLLERKLMHDPAGLEQIRMVFRAGEQAAALTRQLLAFSRKQILQPKVLNLNDLVRQTEKLLQRVIGEQITIVIETNAAVPRVQADPGQIEQVLMNLGVNARDAMPGGGTLTFRTANVEVGPAEAEARGDGAAPGRYVALSVSDSGVGMDAVTRARIFEPFFTTKGPGRGTGLGLATVYGIVKQSQGMIRVESEPGQGCTFTVELPEVPEPVTQPEPKAAPLEPAPKGKTVLAVEDEEVVRSVLCSVLEEAGYDVLCAGNPKEGLEIAKQMSQPLDLLLTDVIMPGMLGTALAERVVDIFPSVRVLYISGYSERDMLEQGIAEGEIEILQKPFTHEKLLRRVKELLSDERVPATAATSGIGTG